MRVNGLWHTKMRISKAPSLQQRIKWHILHHHACNCHPIPKYVLEELKKRKISC